MGDRRRGHIFAAWIRKQFPLQRFKIVADIAGGTGELSFWLHRLGYEPVVFDRRRVRVPRDIEYRRCDISDLHFRREFDIVVALHPDSATWHTIRLAAEIKCPFAIVPCCTILPVGKRLPVGMNWLKWLESEAHQFAFKTWCGQLDMRGQNIVMKGWMAT